MSLSDIETEIGASLPAWFKAVAKTTWSGVQEEYRAPGGQEFYFLRESGEDEWDHLVAQQPFRGKRVTAWKLLAAFADLMRASGEESVDVGGRKKRGLDWLATRVTVGDANGDPIFIDQDDGTLWIFHHDGWDAEKIAGSKEDLEYIADE